MNSGHWCDSLWGLGPVWVLCWAGKWCWWVNRSTPELCYAPTPNPTTHTHRDTHTHTATIVPPSKCSHVSQQLPGPLLYLPAHSCCGPVQSLCVHTLCCSVSTVTLSSLPCLRFFLSPPPPSARVICYAPSTADLTHSMTHTHTVRTTWQELCCRSWWNGTEHYQTVSNYF